MRWKSKPKVSLKLWETVTRRRFLWKPLMLNGETRWLEFATIRSVVVPYHPPFAPFSLTFLTLQDTEFIDLPKNVRHF